MITKNQIESLAKFYQIDNITIVREYLQILFLSYLYRERSADKIFFKGGTAIRLLFGSNRFSEDLDFSIFLSKTEIEKLMKKVEKSMQNELTPLKILLLYQGKNSIRFRLRYQSKDYKYPLIVRLDFNEIKKVEEKKTSPLITKFPVGVFPLINHLSDTEILAEKLCALITRGKGRDLYDVFFLLGKGIRFDKNILEKKLKERGEKYDGQKLINKIKSYPQKQLDRDLSKFLPRSQRKITSMLKNQLEKALINLVG